LTGDESAVSRALVFADAVLGIVFADENMIFGICGSQ
jgi:hypothetical protein